MCSVKVLHVLWDLGQGGAQTYVYDLVRQHQALDQVTSKVLSLSHGGPIAEDIESLGVPVKYMGMRNGYDLVGIIKLRKYLETQYADIIHAHTHNFAFNCLVSRIQIPKIYTEHGGHLLGGRLKSRLAYGLFDQNYRRFIAISEHMAQVMINANSRIGEKINVVYNGTDVNKIDLSIPINGDGFPDGLMQARYRVGIIGRLVPQKGIDTYLEAANIIARKRNNICFIIVGDGPLRHELALKAERLGIKKRTFFLGFQPDVGRIIKTFDVFLFTSNYEPFGLVLTEAMAARVPVVALDMKGSVGEIIEDGVDGFVVEKKDPALLANKVISLLDDQSLRDYFGQNARKKVEQNFTIEQNATKVLQIYKECIDESTK
jgi:glycosyltransferase involved in cell wall biosynthesis